MSSSISCELVFAYETVTSPVAAQLRLAFASPTTVTVNVDGPSLCFQQVHMRREAASNHPSVSSGLTRHHPGAGGSKGADRAQDKAVPAVTSVVAVRVRPPSSFTGAPSDTPHTTFMTELEVYRVPLHDIRSTELNLDPVNAQQAEKPFSILLHTQHTESHSGLHVVTIELLNIPYAAITSFYKKLQQHLSQPGSGNAAKSLTDDGLVRSRSVSQRTQPQQSAPERQRTANEASSSANRYGFLFTNGSRPDRSPQAVSVSTGESEKSTPSSAVASPTQAGTMCNNRYDALAAVGEVCGSGSRGPKEAHRLAKAALVNDKNVAVKRSAKDSAAENADAEAKSKSAVETTAALPPGTVLPTWFPAWDTFYECESTGAKGDAAQIPDTRAGTGGAKDDDGKTPGGASESARKVNGAIPPVRKLDLERELYMLKELRERANEVEAARQELNALKAAMVDKDAARDAHDAALIQRFPHLTPAQRLLVDFDRLLLPLPEGGDMDAGPQDEHGQCRSARPPTESGSQLRIRSAVLALVSRSLYPDDAAGSAAAVASGVRDASWPSLRRTGTPSPPTSLASSTWFTQGACPSQPGSHALASPATAGAPGLPRSASSLVDVLGQRAPTSPAGSTMRTPLRSEAHVVHGRAPLIAPRRQPTLRRRQHNEASAVPTAPTPVATSSVTSSSAPPSPGPSPHRFPSSDSDSSAMQLEPAAKKTGRGRSVERNCAAPAAVGGTRHGRSASLTSRPYMDTRARDADAPRVAASQAGSEGRVRSPPRPLAGTMPPSEPPFLLDSAPSDSMAT